MHSNQVTTYFIGTIISFTLFHIDLTQQSKQKLTLHNETDIVEIKNNDIDYYDYNYLVGKAYQNALDECRRKFKWDKWNCPKKTFSEIMNKGPLPANKEVAFVRALIAASAVLSIAKRCNSGTDPACGCSKQDESLIEGNLIAGNHTDQKIRSIDNSTTSIIDSDVSTHESKFVWKGCDEIVDFGIKVSKIYLDNQNKISDTGNAIKLVNSYNYEVGRMAVKRLMKKDCKCHGISGSCQIKTCWTGLPELDEVAVSLKRQYKKAALVGALNSELTSSVAVKRELEKLAAIKRNKGYEKMAFIEYSPNYCYEDLALGTNGTLGRLCSRENESCEELCTDCGYIAKQNVQKIEKECCRYVHCCSVKCKPCPQTTVLYRCVRHV